MDSGHENPGGPSSTTNNSAEINGDHNVVLQLDANSTVNFLQEDIADLSVSTQITDKDVSRYVEDLKGYYQRRLKWENPVPWFEGGFKLKFADTYTQLELMLQDNRGRRTKGHDLSESLRNDNPGLRVLIEGAPGIGKSTMCRKVLFDWAENNENNVLSRFTLAVLVELRNVQGGSFNLADVVSSQIISENGRKIMRHYIREHPEEVVVFLDGYDEAGVELQPAILGLLEGSQLAKSTVVITSRKNRRAELVKLVDQHYLITGFTRESICEYVTKFFPDEGEKAEKLIQYFENNESIREIAVNPLCTLLFCILWDDNPNSLPNNKYIDIFSDLFLCLFKRFFHKRGDANVSDIVAIPPEYREKLNVLGRVGYEARKINKERFEATDLAELDQEVLEMGILYEEYSSIKAKGQRAWVPLHLTFLEFLAARYLVDSGLALSGEAVREIVHNKSLHAVCVFVVGLLQDARPYLEELMQLHGDLTAGTISDQEYSLPTLTETCLVCLQQCDYREDFLDRFRLALVQNDGINLREISYGAGVLSALARILDSNETAPSRTRASRVLLSRTHCISKSMNFASIFHAISKSQHIRMLKVFVSSEIVDSLSECIRQNASIHHLEVILNCQKDFTSLPLAFRECFSNRCLRSLTLRIHEYRHGYVCDNSDISKEMAGDNEIYLGENMTSFNLTGCGPLPVRILRDTSVRIKLSQLISFHWFFHNNCGEEERKLILADIFASSTSLDTLWVHACDFSENGPLACAFAKNNGIKFTLIFDWPKLILSEEENGVSRNESTRLVQAIHTLSSNTSVQFAIIVFSQQNPSINEALATLSKNNNLKAFVLLTLYEENFEVVKENILSLRPQLQYFKIHNANTQKVGNDFITQLILFRTIIWYNLVIANRSSLSSDGSSEIQELEIGNLFEEMKASYVANLPGFAFHCFLEENFSQTLGLDSTQLVVENKLTHIPLRTLRLMQTIGHSPCFDGRR